MALTGDEYTRNLLLNEIAQKLGLPTMSNLTGDPYTRNLLLEQIRDNVGGSGDAPAYLPEGGATPTGTTEGDRWVSDSIEYQWKPALGAGGAWVEVNGVLMSPQINFAGVAGNVNLWIASPPSGLENGFVLTGLKLSGQATVTAMDATNYWSVFVRYGVSGVTGNNDLTTYTADNDNWNSTAFQFTSQNDAMFLVEPAGPVSTFTMRTLATGTPGNMNAIASVRVHRAKVPA